MATYYQTDREEAFHANQFAHLVEKHCRVAVSKFRKVLHSYALFHLSFLLMLSLLVITSSFLMIMQPSSMIFGVSLSLLSLLLFSYFMIIFYFDGKKSHEFSEIDRCFFIDCQKALPLELTDSEVHFSLASSALQLTSYLKEKENYALSFPPFLFLEDFIVNIRFWLHHKDIISMQERLIRRCIKEHLSIIRSYPTDLEAHTSLANAFITLSYIYQSPSQTPFVHSALLKHLYSKESYQIRAKKAASRAIEELKILDDLAPNDPWVHAQLASCFHFLEMQDEEIREYEILRNLRSEDRDILFRLGFLYFQCGQNAKGLKVYDQLTLVDAKSAATLLTHYNATYL